MRTLPGFIHTRWDDAPDVVEHAVSVAPKEEDVEEGVNSPTAAQSLGVVSMPPIMVQTWWPLVCSCTKSPRGGSCTPATASHTSATAFTKLNTNRSSLIVGILISTCTCRSAAARKESSSVLTQRMMSGM